MIGPNRPASAGYLLILKLELRMLNNKQSNKTVDMAKSNKNLPEEYFQPPMSATWKTEALASKSPWVLVAESSADGQQILVVKERRAVVTARGGSRFVLKSRGKMSAESLRRCLPTIRQIVSRVWDENNVPLEMQRLLSDRMVFRGRLPLDEEAGSKLALIFKLQERIKELDRVELIARRVERFTREEAGYWLSRTCNYGKNENRWAIKGMRIMLGGSAKDKKIVDVLECMQCRN